MLTRISVGELMRRCGEAALQTGPFGTQLKADEYVEEGVPVINVRNVGFGDVRDDDLEFVTEAKAEHLHHHRLVRDDIVFGRKGAVERHGLITDAQEGWVQGSDCLRLRLRSARVDVRYLSYYLRTKAHGDWMHALCSFGATMASLNQDIVSRITFPAPEIEVQRKIAAILSAYDDLIANNQRRIALLEGMAEEIYREWFVRMRFAGWATTPVHNRVPTGWIARKLPEIASITYGFPFAGDRFNSVGIGKLIVRIRDVLQGNSSDYTDEIGPDKCVVQAGDLLIGMDGEFHMNYWAGAEAWLVQRVCKVEAKDARLRGYLARALRAPIKHYEQTIVGATVGHLGAKHLNAIDVLMPPASADGVLQTLNNLLDQKLVLSKQSLQLARTRDALLPRLISGKLKVDHLDIRLPPSMRAEAEVVA